MSPAGTTFKLILRAGPSIEGLARETWLERHVSERGGLAEGFQGLLEGTVLSEEAFAAGLETESWTLDAAEAPTARDWVASSAGTTEVVLYYASLADAERARGWLECQRDLIATELTVVEIQEEVPQDWDAEWKKHYLKNESGVRIPPAWRILPAWLKAPPADLGPDELVIQINPGAGFGTGTHETTQLCLRALAETAGKWRALGSPPSVLDFGSGSGILAIGAALLGARVTGVEVDTMAITNAEDNAELNGVAGSIHFQTHFSTAHSNACVLANILRPILLQFAPEIVDRLHPQGVLILSGLVATDVPEVRARFERELLRLNASFACRELSEKEWRALVFSANPKAILGP